jgi:hypothetical protein
MTGNCERCPCSSYLNRNRPFKSDKAFVILGVFLIGLLTCLALSPFITYTEEQLNKPVELTADVLFTILATFVLLACVCGIYPLYITPYFAAKKRKSYPVEEQLS